MPVPRIFGIETEYGYTHLPEEGRELERPALLRSISRLAPEIAPCVRAADGRGVFLANSSRFYLDWTPSADKPEIATGESSNPVILVRRSQEGDAYMEDLARRVEQMFGGTMIFTKTNVDYASANTWGCHESYLIRRGCDFQRTLVPFLCSRVIYAGSGGFSNLSQACEFTLSTRAPHLQRVIGPDSQHSRPLIHTRDESHARKGDQRIHLIVGEGLYSETALLLRTAATALVVGLIEAGVDVGPSVALRNPVGALRKFSADPLCKAAARIENGSVVRAIDIQRHYLQIAGDNLASLPVWAEPVLNLWKEILDNLESGAEQNEMLRLDWVVRWRLYTKFLQSRGLDWKTMADEASAPALGAIRAELFELDTKFGAVGNQGVFNALDQKGCLRHRIDAARFPGDAPTRADLRGAVIQQICDNKNRDTVVAEWSYLLNRQENTWLDLTDPFEQNAEWKPEYQPETFRFRRIVNLLE